jgi:hypothetical protein
MLKSKGADTVFLKECYESDLLSEIFFYKNLFYGGDKQCRLCIFHVQAFKIVLNVFEIIT